MVQYLSSTTALPISAADIRAELGLHTRQFDGLFEAGIALMTPFIEMRRRVCMSKKIWSVIRDEGKPLEPFFRSIRAIGRPHKIGPGYVVPGKPGIWHDVTYLPDAVHIQSLKASVCNWAYEQDDVVTALNAQRAAEWAAHRCIGDTPILQAAE